ncbi:MAG: glycosyl hydrolase 115 family protein [Lachnospiraceae bacterium]|nr:glycosyl hydrolase 115 family protein [Lachnospiraceae bacterium]
MGITFSKNVETSVFLGDKENSAVRIAAANFCRDLERVCGAKATLSGSLDGEGNNQKVFVFTVEEESLEALSTTFENAGKNADPAKTLPFKGLEACARKLFDINGRLIWEAYSCLVEEGRLYVCGARRRGTIYGLYELSGIFGVSPWHWFADVPVKKRDAVSLPEGFTLSDHPSVKYRGIFINDEEELEAWAQQYFGSETIGPEAYEKIFELLLRLKANYIWPAMHVNAFNADPENGRLADCMGITVGTSHCDMLLRSNQNEWEPWKKANGCENAEYDYSVDGENRDIIKKYWIGSLEQNKNYDVCYTLGMRGIHDSGFITRKITENKALSEEEVRQEKLKLLEKVMADQAELIEKYGNPGAPRIFVPYKEVMNLYDLGLKVPEDITLIWVNDNFGYMRRYPNASEQKRPGGHGLYYHISYWARPGMSWLFYNSMPFAHIKNELKKAYDNGIRNLWVFNVGAIKPLEPDIEFCLTYAWEVERNEVRTADTKAFISRFINSNFSGGFGPETADIFSSFLQLANVRKVEHMRSDVFSQTAFGNEAARRMNRLKSLFTRTLSLYDRVREEEKDAFLQTFAVRIFAAYFIYASYYFGDRSRLMYREGRFAEAEEAVALLRRFDENKRKLLYYYNRVMQGGKWNRVLTPEEFRPPVTALYPAGRPALVLDGAKGGEERLAGTPACSTTGAEPCNSPATGTSTGPCTSPDTCNSLDPCVSTGSCTSPEPCASPVSGSFGTSCFIESDGVVSILAEHYERNTGFKVIKDAGRYEGSLLEADGGSVEYAFKTATSGTFTLELYRFPSLNSVGRIRLGILVDGKEAGTLETEANDEWRGSWRENVMNNVEKMYLELPPLEAGTHTITVVSIDRYAAFSKLVIYTKGFTPSNLGPLESFHPVYNPSPESGEAVYDPETDALDALCTRLFACKTPPLPDVIVCDKAFWGKNRTYLKNTVIKQTALGVPKYAVKPDGTKNVFERFDSGIFFENDGKICFGTEYALENSANAYMLPSRNGIGFEHTNSETDGRTGLAMYVPGYELYFEPGDEPSLNYRIYATGGKYNVWLLLKYDDERNARVGIAIDGREIPQEEMIAKGRLFNYGTKQNWLWMIVAVADIPAGERLFTIRAKASEFKVDRVYLSKTEEWPPVDALWSESERK